jgi:4-amino-4-deoxy-L-arabinose transferase-like glycosyltransferase
MIAVIVFAFTVRIVGIDKVPPSLFGDELDLGYHALSIAQTGKDYSGNFLPLHFQSLAEWRTPLYIYAAVPTVSLFGISPLGVRLPAVIFGVIGIVGLYFLVSEISKHTAAGKNQKPIIDHHKLALLAAAILAISPWHIHYSRAGFEVTMLLAFLIWGFYFFFKSIKNGRYLWISLILLISTPLIYSTAKLFTPILLLFLFVVWRRKLLMLDKKSLFIAGIAGMLVAVPVFYATLSAEGGQRFGYISIFGDERREYVISQQRALDEARDMGKKTYTAEIFHNKWNYWLDQFSVNYLQSFSTQFLFTHGDVNPRHTSSFGQFYRIDFFVLIAGLAAFLFSSVGKNYKFFWLAWLVFGSIPSALTQDGAGHATRLILILPPLVFFIAYGIYFAATIKGLKSKLLLAIYALLILVSFIFYRHHYFGHYPYLTNRWWHDGYGQAIEQIMQVEKNYERVFLTMSDEPMWIFFAGWSQFSPEAWQQGYPFAKAQVEGFGEIDNIDKYYFGEFKGEGGIYTLPSYLGDNDLYLASSKEIGADLLNEPERTPSGLELIDTAVFLTGEPAFYLFAKK